ncbi:MAG: DUF448 domain-containing protein [Firmicutes bacterium HGW-Firmicutes-19]|jgi:uncharacterized protein|nr:MAG: DUF448 domain-containing protein [Firmicutes bacterium HGW-Firmicutes-19]
MKKIPLRKCVATLEQLPKKELLRIVKTPEGEVIIDLTGRANGRGAYLKKSREAVEVAAKKGALQRALECPIPVELFEKLREMFPQ